MRSPSPGFVMEGVATSGCDGRVDGVPPSDADTFYFFDFAPFEMLTSTGADGSVDSQLMQPVAETIRCRNSFSDAVSIGDRMTIIIGADGLGVILVFQC